jgi:hypothetical protein
MERFTEMMAFLRKYLIETNCTAAGRAITIDARVVFMRR